MNNNNPNQPPITHIPTQEELVAAAGPEAAAGHDGDPYLSGYKPHDIEDATIPVTWRQPDGAESPGWIVQGTGTGTDGRGYARVARLVDGRVYEGYIPSNEIVVPERNVSELAPLPAVRPEEGHKPFVDEWPTLSGEEAARVIAEARAAVARANREDVPRRRELDDAGRPIYKP